MTILYFAWFGVMAFLIAIMTEKRWPLAAWSVVVLMAALDYSHQPPAFQRPDITEKVVDRVAAGTPGFTKVVQRGAVDQYGGY